MKTLIQYIIEALDGSRMTYSGKNSRFVDIILENNEGKILILRRANYIKNFSTCWGVVGGSIELTDKDSAAAAVREVIEETGIKINESQQLVMKPLFTYKFKQGGKTDVFHVKLDCMPDVHLSREHSAYVWIDFSNEKIDSRKWMPEIFNILQKWENTDK